MFLLNATKSCLTLVAGELLVAGSVNVHEVKFEFSDDWSDLVKTVTFRTVSDSRSVILNDEGECVIPWEVLKDSSPYLYVGLIGTRDAEVVLPTIWADLGEVRNGTKPGADVTDPTPTVYEQVLSELGSRANNLTVKDEKLQLRSGETVLSEVELPKQEEPGTTDHAKLTNRDAADQHPIEAITGLADALKAKLTKDDVDLVLAQAKESGEFDGYTPVKGKDYYTEADKAELVEEVLEQIPEQPSGGISVDKAEIGQTIVVKAVDENGKPTEWEAADLPAGGGASSWNDLADKPFEETEIIENILPNGVTYEESLPGFIGVATAIPTVGEMYTVTFNGTDYNTIAASAEGLGGVALGNPSLMGGENTGEPFFIVFVLNGEQPMAMAVALDGAQEASIAVYGKVKSVKKLDDIFYNAPCVYYTNSDHIVGSGGRNYMYTDKECTNKVTLEELKGALGKPIAIMYDEDEEVYNAIFVHINSENGNGFVGSLSIFWNTAATENTVRSVVFWTA